MPSPRGNGLLFGTKQEYQDTFFKRTKIFPDPNETAESDSMLVTAKKMRIWIEARSPWLYFLILLTASIIFISGSSHFYGIDPYDESVYIDHGYRGFLHTTWGPLYVQYYRLLNFFTGDALKSYYFNLKFLSLALPLLHFCYLQRLKVSPLIAFLSSIYLLIASFNAPLIPKASHFSLIFIFSGLIATTYQNSRSTGILWALLLLLPAIFVRQDLALAWLALFAYATYELSGRGRLTFGHTKILVTIGIVGFCLTLMLGNILSGPRSWIAFTDTFFYNHPERGTNRFEAIASTFPNAASISAAALENPSAFLEHISRNFAQAPNLVFLAFAKHFTFTTADFDNAWRPEFLGAISLLLLAAALGRIFQSKRQYSSVPLLEREKIFLIVYSALLLKTVVVIGIFWSGTPRYILEVLFLSPALVAWLCNRYGSVSIPCWLGLALATALLFFVPSHESCPKCKVMTQVPAENSAIRIVKHIRAMNFREPRTCFYASSIQAFFGSKMNCLQASMELYGSANYPSPKSQFRDLKSFLIKSKVDLVVIDDPMRLEMASHGKLAELDDLVKNPGKYGFSTRHELPDRTFILLR